MDEIIILRLAAWQVFIALLYQTMKNGEFSVLINRMNLRAFPAPSQSIRSPSADLRNAF